MTDRRSEESRRDTDQTWSRRLVIQTVLTILISLGSAFGGAVMGTRTKTAVLENAVTSINNEMARLSTQITNQNNETKAEITKLAATVSDSKIKSAEDSSQIKSDLVARTREIDVLRRELSDATARLDRKIEEEANKRAGQIDWKSSEIQGLRDKISTIQGQMNAAKREKE